ncbi:MAG: DUF1116 domain-containing protein [Caldilineales bacterium]
MMDIERANQTAVERMTSARPSLTGVAPARDVIPGMRDTLLLHAGPPITWERASGPLRGAIIGALIFEGLATDEASAEALVRSGEVTLEPCHEHDSVGPMAGVTSASMMVNVVENVTHGNRAFCNLNEGYGKVLRYGAYSPEVIAKLRWMNEVLGTVLAEALALTGEGVDMRALLAESLQMGDEGHNRNKAGSILFTAKLAPYIVRTSAGREEISQVLQFMVDNALIVLNPVMAACKAMADAGHGVEGSTVMTTMARNGTDLGIRVSGLGDRWFTGPSQVPDGLYFPGFTSADANPDIGDSTITETAGIGVCDGRRAGHRLLRQRHTQGCGQHDAGDVRDHRGRASALQDARAGLPRHAGGRGHPQGHRAGHPAEDQHRDRPPRGGHRPGRRRPGAAAGGGVREGADGVRGEVSGVVAS